MIIEEKLTMETIYQTFENHISANGKLENNFDLDINQDYKLHIYSYSENFSSFVINNQYYKVFSSPIKY